MPHLLLIMSVLGCGGEDPPASGPGASSAPTPAGVQAPVTGPGSPGAAGTRGAARTPRATAAEDLRGSWRSSLGATVPPSPEGDCPDADGDGAPDARRCGAAPETLDCDDQDPAVGPTTERWIPAGPFLMGSASDQAGRDEGPVHVVQLSGYCLDLHEASAEHVGAWARAAGRTLVGPDLVNLSPDGTPAPGKARHPATGLTWDEASDYCAASGKALPTEAQWEKAARGGCELGSDPLACDPADLRPYAWGSAAPDCTRANHQSGSMPGPASLCVGGTSPIDALPAGAGPYGHLNIAGNAWEWVADAYHPAVYTEAVRTDPGGPSDGPYRVMRGGGWSTFGTNMRAANRFEDLVLGSPTGVRCARPTAATTPDPVPPLTLVALSGEISTAEGVLQGRALYVTAFDAADLDARTGLLTPGRSPAAEARLTPNGAARQRFTVDVPTGGSYMLSAALDAGGPAGDGFAAPSGTGGMGQADANPIQADGDVDGIRIRLQAAPAGGPERAAGGPAPGQPRHGGAHGKGGKGGEGGEGGKGGAHAGGGPGGPPGQGGR